MNLPLFSRLLTSKYWSHSPIASKVGEILLAELFTPAPTFENRGVIRTFIYWQSLTTRSTPKLPIPSPPVHGRPGTRRKDSSPSSERTIYHPLLKFLSIFIRSRIPICFVSFTCSLITRDFAGPPVGFGLWGSGARLSCDILVTGVFFAGTVVDYSV